MSTLEKPAPPADANTTLTPAEWQGLLARLTEPLATPRTLGQPLARHQMLWRDHPQGCQVECTGGALWLTFDGVLKDYILEAGEVLVCPHDSRLGIQALKAATLILTPARNPPR